MKKIITLAITLATVLSFTACGGTTDPALSDDGTATPDTQQTEQPSDMPNEGTPSDGDTSGGQISDVDPSDGDTYGGDILDSDPLDGDTYGTAPTTVILPENVQMIISLDGDVDQTTIKIGKDFYSEDRYGEKIFYKYNTDDEWISYTLQTNGDWEENGYCTYDEVIENCFISIGRYTALDVDLVATGRSQVIAGVQTKEYKYVLNDADLFCWLSDDGISFNHNDIYIITVWNTDATSFGVDIP